MSETKPTTCTPKADFTAKIVPALQEKNASAAFVRNSQLFFVVQHEKVFLKIVKPILDDFKGEKKQDELNLIDKPCIVKDEVSVDSQLEAHRDVILRTNQGNRLLLVMMVEDRLVHFVINKVINLYNGNLERIKENITFCTLPAKDGAHLDGASANWFEKNDVKEGRNRVKKCAQALLKCGHPKDMDIFHLTQGPDVEQWDVGFFGAGCFADADKIFAQGTICKRLPYKMARMMSGIVYILFHMNRYEVNLDYVEASADSEEAKDTTLMKGKLLALGLCNVPHLADGISLTPDAKPNDGAGHLVAVIGDEKVTRFQALRTFLAMRRGVRIEDVPDGRTSWVYMRVKNVMVVNQEPEKAQMELSCTFLPAADEAHVQVIPSALSFLDCRTE